MESVLAVLALIGAVIVVSALLSGWVDRTGVPPDARALVGGYAALTKVPKVRTVPGGA